MVLQSNTGGDFKPHPEGIHPAVCLDVIDLGLQETEFQGQVRMAPKVKLVFESEQRLEDGRNCTISKNFTASLHPKAKLAEFLGKWRGRPVVPGETIDLGKLIGASCTLVISHQQNMRGQIYAGIDAISKPTKKLAPSGFYDPAAARHRIEEWKAKQQAGLASHGVPAPGHRGYPTSAPIPMAGAPAPAPQYAPRMPYAPGASPSQGRAVYAPAPQAAYYQQPAPAPLAQYPQRIRSLRPWQRRRRSPTIGRQSLPRRFPPRPQPRKRKGRTRVTTRKSGSDVNIDEIIP
jgi:hypothetical protein